jgi:DNA-directed RNA polymerase specialized sigma24 family protein
VRLSHVSTIPSDVAAVSEGPETEERDGPVHALFLEHYRRLVGTASLITGSPAVAEDIVQDAFANFLRRRRLVRSPAAYLTRAVVNGSYSHLRRAHVESRVGPLLASGDEPAPGDPLWDALGALTPPQRAALVLRFYEDRTDEEIARVLRCRPSTVRSHVRRGLLHLKRVIVDAS